MIELDQIESFFSPSLRKFKKNMLREYLQYKILEAVYQSALGINLIFMGGTSIHIIHGSQRFSEDLDFDNLGLDEDQFKQLSRFVTRQLKREGYSLETKTTPHPTGGVLYPLLNPKWQVLFSFPFPYKLLLFSLTHNRDYPYPALTKIKILKANGRNAYPGRTLRNGKGL